MSGPWEDYATQPQNAGPWADYTPSPPQVAAPPPIDPTQGMSTWQKYLAGYGRGVSALGTGALQAANTLGSGLAAAEGGATLEESQQAGQEIRQDIAESRRLDAPLLATSAGKWGNITGIGATLLPTAFIPGANTLLGSAAIGGSVGFLQPSTSTREAATNTAFGAATAPASILAGRLLAAGYQGVKGLASPFFKGGQEGITARTLVAAAGGPEEAQLAAQRIASAQGGLPGVSPTTAELANNAGLSQLERTIANNPEYVTAYTNRLQANRSALTQALGQIGGTDADVAAAEAARETASAPLYAAARGASVPVDKDLATLLQRPSMQTALERATRLAAERGDTLGSIAEGENISGSGLQYLKMSLQDTLNSGHQQGMGAHEIGAIRGTLNALNDWTSRNVPALRSADEAFRQASAPINQMEIGQALSQKLQPSLADFGANTRLNASSYANALRNGNLLAARATGWKGATLENTMSPDQLQTLQLIGQSLANRANVSELGKAVGSNTTQNLVSQNMLRQMLGPLGLPQGWAERGAQSTLLQSFTRPVQWAGQIGQGRALGRLAQAVLTPEEARRLLLLGAAQQAPGAMAARQGLLAIPALTYSAQQ